MIDNMKQLSEVVKGWLKRPAYLMFILFLFLIISLIVIRYGIIGPT